MPESLTPSENIAPQDSRPRVTMADLPELSELGGHHGILTLENSVRYGGVYRPILQFEERAHPGSQKAVFSFRSTLTYQEGEG